MLRPLCNAITLAKPDVVVVSGDLTQRARASQFAQARDFLKTLPGARIVVPGNHDVPLFNVLSRWLWPLHNFRRYITNDLEPFYSDGEIAVLGVNTARSWTFKNGRINQGQVARSCTRLGALPDGILRVVATHHPFAVPDAGSHRAIGRAAMAIERFAGCRVDVILSGHLHTSHTMRTVEHYVDATHSALLVQAGTATSSRRRGEENAFNILRAERETLNIEKVGWDGTKVAFLPLSSETFQRVPGGWDRVSTGSAH